MFSRYVPITKVHIQATVTVQGVSIPGLILGDEVAVGL